MIELDVRVIDRKEIVELGRYINLGAVVAHDCANQEQDSADDCPEAEDEVANPQGGYVY
jgi:hypothetical protein